MELITHVLVPLLAVCLATLASLKWFASYGRKTEPGGPPGPWRWPILGNIPVLAGDLPHKSLAKLASKNGWPIMSLQVSTLKMLIVSTPELAKEVLVKSGITFASRDTSGSNFAMKILLEDPPGSGKYRASSGAPYGHPWRRSRKILTAGLIKAQKFYGDRLLFEELNVTLEEIERKSRADPQQVYNVREQLWKLLMNHNLRLMYGKRFADNDPFEAELIQLNDDVGVSLAKGAIVQIFPILAPFYRSWKKRTERVFHRRKAVTEELLEHRIGLGNTAEEWYLADTVMEAETLGEIDHIDALHILDEVNVAGVETTASTVEWGLTHLANRPEIAHNIREEAERVIGKGIPIRAEHIDRLPYLRAFVKETFRMHMHLPLLLPHVNEEPAELGGFHIPAKSAVAVNAYAIAHDPEIWPDPQKFEPERFLKEDVDVTGRDCRLLPFGAGRRSCPGYPLALPQVHLILGRFVQQFELLVPNCGARVDTRDEFGVGVRKKVPLKLSFRYLPVNPEQPHGTKCEFSPLLFPMRKNYFIVFYDIVRKMTISYEKNYFIAFYGIARKMTSW